MLRSQEAFVLVLYGQDPLIQKLANDSYADKPTETNYVPNWE